MTARWKVGVVAAGVLSCIAATTALGFWQLRRAAGKESLQLQIDAAAAAPATMPDAASLSQPASLVYRHLRFEGRWLPTGVVYLDNRPQSGQAGFYVLMPLRVERPMVADVIVNRGWIPRDARERTRIAPYRTPDGTVEVSGVALAEEPRLFELATPGDRPLPGIWQNFDVDAYAHASGRRPLPIVLREDNDARAAADGLSRDWPDRGGALQSQIDRHHGYAFQWFALAVALVGFVVYRALRMVRHGRVVV